MSRRILAAVLLGALCLALGAPSALAAPPTPRPAFKLSVSSQPTNFLAGADPGKTGFPEARPQYSVIATNIGSEATSGAITFTDTLPAGLTPVLPLHRPYGMTGASPCAVAGQTVTCSEPEPLQPGEWLQFLIPVKVAAEAPASVVNEASIDGGGAAAVAIATTTKVSESEEDIPSFDFLPGAAGLSAAATDVEGEPETRAGAHPYGLTIDLGFPSAEVEGGPKGAGSLYSAGHPRNLRVTLPRGMVANPTSAARCTEAELEAGGGEALCPDSSQVGTVTALTQLLGAQPVLSPIYNMVPPPGAAAEFGFDFAGVGIYVHLFGGVNVAGEYELVGKVNDTLAREGNPILGAQVQLWGNPTDESHDAVRGKCTNSSDPAHCRQPEARSTTPFLTMPSSCRASLQVRASASSWEAPGQEVSDSAALEDPANGAPTETSGCNQLAFKPRIEARPTTVLSDSPSGLDFDLHIPQTNDFESLASANVKDVSVSFPPGLVVNPSGANGLGACSSAQVGLTSAIGQMPIRFDEAPAACPDAAKIGAVEVMTPALDHPLPGALYVASPFDNPFGSFLAAYIVVDDRQSGIVAKLAGRVEPDPQSGQLRTTFKENPELPFEEVKLRVFVGPEAALKTPLPCGLHTTSALITPWSEPQGASVTLEDPFETSVAAGGAGPCPASEASAPHRPSFSAGTINPQAGAYSPFVLKLTREDGSQRLAAIDTTLPKGLIGKLAGIPYCSEAQIAAAKAREAPNLGGVERASPSCPLASEVGTVNVGAGAGPAPFYAQGRAYLAGPYKGAPLSMVVITPAVAGPFDLGAVVARVAFYINSETAQVRALSDPLPTILQGVPLDVRSIALKLDRPNFILNPTNCNPMALLGSALSVSGQSAPLSSPFQVGGCKGLKFAPKLKISLKGATKRTGHPALKAVLTYPKGGHYANIKNAQVTLPHSEFLDTTHIGTVCTRVQFAADTCPKGAIYGFARAFTPLLDKPIEGPVYLRSSSHKLPDLVFALNGQVDADLVSRVDTGKANGIRSTIEAAPDAPVSKFVLEMKGGKKGLLVNSEDICRKPQRAIANFTAQNGKVVHIKPLIANSCK